jgi:hypothetical protein
VGSFNTEQQASIVDDWFAGAPGASPPIPPKDETQGENPYFRYIRDNIRAGIA